MTLPAKLTKNGKPAVQPLPPGVAYQLGPYLAGKDADAPLWPGRWYKKAARMLRRDLKAAGVEYVVNTQLGPGYLDFHSLRHSFVSALAAAGVAPKVLQDLARHSDPRLTLGVYTHAAAADRAAAVGKLALPGADIDPLASLARADLENLTRTLAGLVAVLVAGPNAASDRKPSEDVGKLPPPRAA